MSRGPRMNLRGPREETPLHLSSRRLSRKLDGTARGTFARLDHAATGRRGPSEEVAESPELDRRMVKLGGDLTIYRLSDGKRFEEVT